MNTDQQTRLEIMRALEKDFPDRVLEDLIDVARYVEGDASAAVEEAKEFQRGIDEARMYFGLDPVHLNIPDTPRKWTNLDAIPSSVKAITDRDGDRAEPQMIKGQRKWVFTDLPFDAVEVIPDGGPFTEVLENE